VRPGRRAACSRLTGTVLRGNLRCRITTGCFDIQCSRGSIDCTANPRTIRPRRASPPSRAIVPAGHDRTRVHDPRHRNGTSRAAPRRRTGAGPCLRRPRYLGSTDSKPAGRSPLPRLPSTRKASGAGARAPRTPPRTTSSGIASSAHAGRSLRLFLRPVYLPVASTRYNVSAHKSGSRSRGGCVACWR